MMQPVTIGRMPGLEIEKAMCDGDSAGMWKLSSSGIPMDVYFDTVGTHAFNASTAALKRSAIVAVHNSSMFLWPVVFKRGTYADAIESISALGKEGILNTVRSLSKLMSFRSDICMLREPLAYQFVATQDPVELRKMLGATANRQNGADIGANVEQIPMPEDAPQLAFFVGSITQQNGWPRLPDRLNRDLMEVTNQFHTTLRLVVVTPDSADQEGNIVVGAPEFAQHAIKSGLGLWVAALHEQYSFERWETTLCGQDRVDLTIKLGNDEEVVIPLRSYQIGRDGIDAVIGQVNALAPSPSNVGSVALHS